ncbi:CaiB/BaiF CoA transferase family protein [Cupriavidus sp. 2TAF22]|uniref:CaiB/BaiF CoA transferase family protein n=1 Tax=unclassified Cupriavidus TaxID=2640874 RepID=UPI003F90011B
MGALSHLRVLDLSRVLAGPWASQILADLGAEVIKVERPDTGDDTRSWGPPWVSSPEWSNNERQSAYFAGANRNKQSVAVDLSHPRGQAMVQALAEHCDVVVENFKVGGLKQYGLDYESLREINPRIVYCSITGFGQTGPYSHRPGYDFLVQGMGGLMSITGRPDGEPGEGPLKVGVALTDIMTGLYATIGILAALAHRETSGRGQYVDAALLDVQVACLANQAMNFLASGAQPPRLGNGHPNIVPYQDFSTADGHIIITVGNEGQFARLCEVLGQPLWTQDPRFASNSARIANRAVLIPLIQAVIDTRESQHWLERLEASGVPCGPINTLQDVFADPHVIHRGMTVALDNADGSQVSVVASPIRLSATPVEYRSAPPNLGSSTAAVLKELLKIDDAQIQRLAQEKIIRI